MSEFDVRTHIVDPKTGKMIKHQPYRLHVSKEDGTFFFRDGIKYHPDGTPAEKPVTPSILAEPKEAEKNVSSKPRS